MAEPVDHQTALERRCRRMLFAYPAEYRQRRGDEIVGTMLDSAGPGRRTPRLADAADVVAGGVRHRLGVTAIDGFEAGLVITAPVALALAAGISAFAWLWVEPVSLGAYMGGSALLGRFRTLGPVAYAAWMLAVLARAVLPARAGRAMIAAAVAVTVGVPLVAPLTTVDRPPLWVLMALVVFGGLALAGTSGSVGAPARTSRDERVGVVLGTVAVAVAAHAVMVAWPPSGSGFGYYYQPTLARVGTVAALAVAGVAAVGVLRHLRGHGGRDWLWAAALLGLPAGWLGPFDSSGLRIAADASVPHFGRLAQVLLASCVAAGAIAWLAGQRRPGTRFADRAPLAPVGVLAVGSGAGLIAFLTLGGLGMIGFAASAGRVAVPGHTLAAVAVVLVAGVCALAGGPLRRTGLARRGPAVAALAFGAAWVVSAYDNGWTVGGWSDYPHTVSLVATLAFVPLGAGAVVAARLVRRPDAAPRVRRAALALLGLGAGWVGYASLPHVLAWGPVLLVLLACVAVVVVTRRGSATASGSGRMGAW